MKNIYEIFDEFESVKTKKEKKEVIGKNLSRCLVDVLLFTYHPEYQWRVNDLPENYRPSKNTKPGISPCHLSTEMRKFYLFLKGNPTSDRLSERKINELLIQLIESLEPREAEVVRGIFKKDQGVEGLDYNLVKEMFPQLLP